jgi:hypothetical protein
LLPEELFVPELGVLVMEPVAPLKVELVLLVELALLLVELVVLLVELVVLLLVELDFLLLEDPEEPTSAVPD